MHRNRDWIRNMVELKMHKIPPLNIKTYADELEVLRHMRKIAQELRKWQHGEGFTNIVELTDKTMELLEKYDAA